MQAKNDRRSNKDRTAATRGALIAAARKLFVEKGYAETGTPEIVATANVTRGALYHHFSDKADLFRAVVEAEATAVSSQIVKESANTPTAVSGLLAGADAYFSAMSAPGRAHLLLLDGPAVLGQAEMIRIDMQTGGAELRTGLRVGMESGELVQMPLDAMTAMLSAAFDKAALAISAGEPAGAYKDAITQLVKGLAANALK